MNLINDPDLINTSNANEEVKSIAETYDLDSDRAERVVEIMDEYGVDESDAVEIEDAGL